MTWSVVVSLGDRGRSCIGVCIGRRSNDSIVERPRARAETVALTLVGLALFGTGQVRGGKPAAAPTRSTETALSKAN